MQTVEPTLELAPDLSSELSADLPNVTQSKYFSPAFNAAIFDGPLRIYFAQYQESEALKVYFRLQEHFKFDQKRLSGALKEAGSHVFVMLYPTSDIFVRSFAEDDSGHRIASGRIGRNIVVGVNGAVAEEDYSEIFSEVALVFDPTKIGTDQ